MKKILSIFAGFIAFSAVAFSQSITTANDFFTAVSNNYATINDYEANVQITIGKTEMSGKISFKRPELVRIDFTDPAEQCLNFDGSTLKVYLPDYSAILEQTVTGSSQGTSGLSLIKRYYTISYETGQTPVPLEDDSDEMVINLICYRRTATESFRSIRLSIDPATKLIVRIEAVSSQGENYTITFSDYNLNTGMGDQRFQYDPPSSANNYSNFLYEE